MSIEEIVGAIASTLTIASFAVKGEKMIRFINSLACIAFIIHGLMLSAIGVWSANAVVLCIQIWRIVGAKQEANRNQ